MFNFCHCHVQWCQKGCSRSVVMSKWAINFKNKPDPSTPKLSWRQQPFRSTLQIHKPSFIPQEVTTKNHGIFAWQIPEGNSMCMLAVLLHEPYREVKHYTIPTWRQRMIWRACHKLRSVAEQTFWEIVDSENWIQAQILPHSGNVMSEFMPVTPKQRIYV